MLSTCSQNEQGIQGTWELFQQMDLEGFQPDRVTFVTLLDCCASFADLRRGRQVHQCAVASGMDLLPTVANCVVNMYGKCDDLEEARRVFESLSYGRDVVSWNVMLSIYVQAAGENDSSASKGRDVFELRRRMDMEGVKPNAITLISMVDAAAVWEEIEEGEFLRSRIIESGYGSNVAVCNSLVNMYGKCHSLGNAKEVFWSMEERKNEISWSSLVAAYAQNNQATEAMKLFQHMDLEGLKPDRVTLISVLDACGDLRASKQSSQIHARVLEADLERDVVVANALVSMYGKLGRLEQATVIFETMGEKSVISWNTMVVELAKAGRCESALEAFRSMSLEGLEQSSSGLVAVLFACSHAGLVEQGREIFLCMLEDRPGEDPMPRAEHYGCMVDLLGRSGRLDKAEELIENMPFVPDCVVWNMLLASSKSYGDVERGKRAANEVLAIAKSMRGKKGLSSTNESPYVALASVLEGKH
ncbi:pentatricopeptide repeat-containing protein At2g13600-like [Selaginella moellendorffii]|uniref:pentatricopeptide repeat-containing protein At2g13600-like n=1 Tax=Selaginella moellendorffii TaxID=88036 RepID=UPI000D1C67AB|nr:pentatricopeptide repeat-containing protein At2g13600-like [Selaginella moellendorffii]|eukprot:XP_024519383.1 pentatricopeptide repeat-containing protein At2g13600-like [Selaginella moellendorffii]